jgi:hypothetical protein
MSKGPRLVNFENFKGKLEFKPNELIPPRNRLEIEVSNRMADIQKYNDRVAIGERINGRLEVKSYDLPGGGKVLKIEFIKDGQPLKFTTPDGVLKDVSYSEYMAHIGEKLSDPQRLLQIESNAAKFENTSEKLSEIVGKQLAEAIGIPSLKDVMKDGVSKDFIKQGVENFTKFENNLSDPKNVTKTQAESTVNLIKNENPSDIAKNSDAKKALDTTAEQSTKKAQELTKSSDEVVKETQTKLENDKGFAEKTADELAKKAETPQEKSFWESLKEKFKDNMGILALAALGIGGLTYLFIQADMDEGSGCFVTVQNKIDSNKTFMCKLDRLICNDTNKSSSGTQYDACASIHPLYALNTTNLSTNPAVADAIVPGFDMNLVKRAAGTTSGGDYVIEVDSSGKITGKLIMLTNACSDKTKNTENDACSKLCDSRFMKTEDANNTYDYQCRKRTAIDSFKRAGLLMTKFFKEAINTVNSTADVLGGIFKAVKKYIGYIIVGMIILIVGFKVAPWVLEKLGKKRRDDYYDRGGQNIIYAPPYQYPYYMKPRRYKK